MPASNIATGITITNPLVKYRSLLATKSISPDQGQLRLALHLQKLYDRLKDYEPQAEYSHRLDQLSKTVATSAQDAPPSHRPSSWRALLAAKERRDSLALTRRLTDHESAIQMRSPRGLMLHGEVGTGKSMLVDLFADCLPNRKKARLHFSTFMLQTFARLEAYRRAEAMRSRSGGGGGDLEGEYSLLRLAREMIEQHPILFLDEFQMPDRVASKILTNLMTSFFHLGGVLIATSNRMPEELAKASGVEFAPPPPARMGGWWGRKRVPDRFAGPSEFAAFLDVLRARCEVWEMEGGRDYRRVESGKTGVKARAKEREMEEAWRVDGHEDLQHSSGMAGWPEDGEGEGEAEEAVDGEAAVTAPRYYAVSAKEGGDAPMSYEDVLKKATGTTNVPFAPAELTVYGRRIAVPRAFQGTTQWTFDELCRTTLGPADYSTLASSFHTLILTDVPVLTWLMKNEARRFITLLDALYECRCKLYISAAAGPDELFFPDQREEESADAVYAETFSEAYQDATAPFRPNILSQNPNYVEPAPEPDYTHARLAGLLNADALEDDPPNKPHASKPSNAFSRSFGRTDAEMERGPIDPDEVRYPARPSSAASPDFGKASKFTGEDERFAYKRAQSRLWEMCGAKWWAREGEGWHRPLPAEVRRWERGVADAASPPTSPSAAVEGDVAIGDAVADETRDERSFRRPGEESVASPFRTTEEPPPKLDSRHIWSLGLWGKAAGAWGKGTEGLKDREKEREGR